MQKAKTKSRIKVYYELTKPKIWYLLVFTAFAAAITASNILFGKSTSEDLMSLDEDTFLSVFDGVPQFEVSASDLETDIFDFLAEKTQVFASKGEARRMIQSNAVSLNKEKIGTELLLSEIDLISNKYLLVQKGKKNYFLITVI